MRFRLIKPVFCYLPIACLCLAIAWSPVAYAAAKDEPPSKEYFVNQQAGEALLIKLESFEAEVESRVYGPEKSLLAVSSLPGNRIAPLFQFIMPADSARQLDIEVRTRRKTANSKIEIEFTRLKAWDDRSNRVMRAYLLLSYSMLEPQRSVKAAWTDRVSALISAAKLFAEFGMQEQRLWSSYLAAYLAYHRLGDVDFARELNGKVLDEVNGSRWQQIELAALELKAGILIGTRKTGNVAQGENGNDPVQAALFAEAQLAETMGNGYQHAWAVYNSGLDYAEQKRYPQALAQYQNALKIAEPLADGQFLNDIREQIVAANTKLGNAPASGRVLHQIEKHLLSTGHGDELALNLLQQGKLALQDHRYPQAKAALTQALEHQNDSSIQSRVNFALAEVSFETGDADAVLAHLKAAGIDSGARPSGHGGGLLDTAAGLGMMAAVYRSRGEFGAMSTARAAQRAWLAGQAEKSGLDYQQGLDALAQEGRARTRAAVYFRRSYREALTAAGQNRQRFLAQLQLCAIQRDNSGPCGADGVEQAYRALSADGIPRQTAAADWLYALYLSKHGRPGEAATRLQQLVADIHFYRQRLPGALGSWYWQWHDRVFGDYLDMVGRAPANAGSNDFESLLALTQIRFAARPPPPPALSGTKRDATDTLRAQLAQLEAAKGARPAAGLLAAFRQGVTALRRDFDAGHRFLTAAGLRQTLDTLSPSEAVLTYHLTNGAAQAWLARGGLVKRFYIDQPGRLYASLENARGNFQHIPAARFDQIMQELGQQLLAPLAGHLPETVYFVPEGLLIGFPVDALKLDSHYLAERHRLVNLLTFPSERDAKARLKMPAPKRVFLAGYPQDYSAKVESSLETSAQIRAVADLFVGPGLQILQGGALLSDEFRDNTVQQADLLHLTMPGLIDLAERDRSSLTLSEPERGAGRETLTPADIASVPLKAGLVFLSDTQMQGEPREVFNVQPGLVSAYLDTGAGAVIASSWQPGGDSAIELVKGFYNALAMDGDIAAALAKSKREYLRQHERRPSADWAAYQIYIR